jgi:hypothetical protein
MTASVTSEFALSEIEKIHAVLSTARRLTHDGRSVDLGAVDDRIRRLCETVEGLPRTQGRALAPALAALLAEFDALAQDLAGRFGGLLSLTEIGNTKDAALAYGDAAKHFP